MIFLRKIINGAGVKEVWEKFIQINFFLNDFLFIYISMRGSDCNL
jgi:hypothetical protein